MVGPQAASAGNYWEQAFVKPAGAAERVSKRRRNPQLESKKGWIPGSHGRSITGGKAGSGSKRGSKTGKIGKKYTAGRTVSQDFIRIAVEKRRPRHRINP